MNSLVGGAAPVDGPMLVQLNPASEVVIEQVGDQLLAKINVTNVSPRPVVYKVRMWCIDH